jgi:predicted component of type VI protein secretion system
MRARRLEDRIRELCAHAVTAQESELESIFSALQHALREHNDRLRKLAAEKLAAWHSREAGISVLQPVLRASFACAICSKPIPLEDSKVSEDGLPIHEECYVAKLATGMPLAGQQ